MEATWQHINDSRLGIMNSWSSMLDGICRSTHSAFPNLRCANTILLGTDFGGEHKQSKYLTTSCLIADADKFRAWMTKRLIVRKAFMPDGRRMAYKSLNDFKRRNAFLSFLNAADEIPGILITVALAKRSKHLWSFSPFTSALPHTLQEVIDWPASTLDKAFRVSEIASMFLSGLSKEGQNVLWITDEDEIVANSNRHRQFCKLFGHVSGHYIKHNMEKFEICTTKSDTGSRDPLLKS